MTLICLSALLAVCIGLEGRRHVGGGWANDVADLAMLVRYPLCFVWALALLGLVWTGHS